MVHAVRLENGVACLCEERPGTGLVSMQVIIKFGSQYETPDEEGLTFLAQESTNGGTKTLSRDDLADAIEARGGFLSTESDRDMVRFLTKSLARDVDYSFALLADVVRNPAFDAEEVEQTKEQIADWIDQKSQSPSSEASKNFMYAAFANQALAHDPMGSKDKLATYTAEQVSTYYYQKVLSDPARIAVSFAGDVDAATAERLTRQFFSDLSAASVPVTAPTFSFTQGDIRVEADNSQLNLRLGFPAVKKRDPQRYNVMLLNELLSGGMSSPLFQEIREKRGLVYSVGASYSSYDSVGLFSIGAGTGKGKAAELITATLDLLGDIIRNGFSDAEIAIARSRIVREVQSLLEDAEKSGKRNALLFLEYGHVSSLALLEHNLNQVTGDHIRLACADLLQAGLYAFSGLGPLETIPSEAEMKDLMAAQLKDARLPARAPQNFILDHMPITKAADTTSTIVPQITVLDNGMTIVTAERPGSLSCGAWVGVGSDHETLQLSGATHMNEHMMFKGTPHYPAGTIDKIIEGKFGGDLNAYTNKDQTAYYMFNLERAHLEETVDILGEMVFHADITEDEYGGKVIVNEDGTPGRGPGERDVVIEEIGIYNDRVASRRWDAFYSTTYPNQSHGRPILGTEESLRGTNADALRAYRDEFYVANNVIFVAAGPVSHADFVALIKSKFGTMPKVDFEPLPKPVYHPGIHYVEMTQAKQCNLILATESVSENDPEIYIYNALADILGGGHSSRLQKELVNKKKLISTIGAGNSDYRNAGTFVIVGTVAAAKLRPVVRESFAELRRLIDTITPEELEKAKAGMEMAALSELETNRDTCDYYGRTTLSEGRLVTEADISARINAITLDDIRRVALKILRSEPSLVAIVPPDTDKAFLPSWDELVALRDEVLAA